MPKNLKILFASLLLLILFSNFGTFAQPIKYKDTKRASLYARKGEEQYDKRNYKDAIRMLEKAVDAGATDGWVFTYLSSAYMTLNNNRKAEYWAAKMVEVHPGDANAYKGAAFVFHNTHNYQQALYYYEMAASLRHDEVWIYDEIAEMQLRVDKTKKGIKEAEKTLVEALHLQPSRILDKETFEALIGKQETEKMLERVYKRYKRDKIIENAKNFFDMIISNSFYFLDSNKVFLTTLIVLFFGVLFYWSPIQIYFLYRGNICFRKNNHEDAAKCYERLLYFRHGKFAPYSRLKEIYLKLGRKDEKAIHVFEKMYKENPEDREVIAALANAYANKEK